MREQFAQTRRELREAAERDQHYQERVLPLMEGYGRMTQQDWRAPEANCERVVRSCGLPSDGSYFLVRFWLLQARYNGECR